MIVIIGIGICVFDFITYSRQKLTEKYAFLWAVVGAVMILSGAVSVLSGWKILFGLLLLVFLFMLYTMSRSISDLTRKNQELAMQVSLLNNENEQMLTAMRHLKENKDREK
jgi:Ca2+/Na+ antiporter